MLTAALFFQRTALMSCSHFEYRARYITVTNNRYVFKVLSGLFRNDLHAAKFELAGDLKLTYRPSVSIMICGVSLSDHF